MIAQSALEVEQREIIGHTQKMAKDVVLEVVVVIGELVVLI